MSVDPLSSQEKHFAITCKGTKKSQMHYRLWDTPKVGSLGLHLGYCGVMTGESADTALSLQMP